MQAHHRLPLLQPSRLPRSMTALNLQGCEHVCDDTLSALSMPRLVALNLAFTGVSNEGLMALPQVRQARAYGEVLGVGVQGSATAVAAGPSALCACMPASMEVHA